MTIYIDDSGTSPENAVAVVAGWIAYTDSWVDFQADWDKARNIDGDKFDSMHMAESTRPVFLVACEFDRAF